MGRAGILLLGLFVLLSTVWVSSADAATPPRQPTRVFGSVTFGESPAPAGTVVSATVSGISYKTTTTDGSGNFAFNVPADNLDTNAKDGAEEGDTVVMVVGPDSGVSGSGYTGNVGAYSVTFGVGATPAGLTLAVPSSQVLSMDSTAPSAPTVGTLVTSNNTLKDMDGSPISGVTVGVVWGDGGSDSGTTDGSGGYAVNHVYSAVGSYNIAVNAGKSGYTSASSTHSVNVVAAASTGGGGGFFFRPRQPTPTETPTPTPTPTITPTPTATPIATPTPVAVPVATPEAIDGDAVSTTTSEKPELVPEGAPTPTVLPIAIPTIDVPEVGEGMVVGGLSLSDDSVGPGVPVKVNFTVQNESKDIAASPYTITIVVNGEVETTLNGTLKGGGIRSLSHFVSRSVPGSYTVAVGDLVESFVVTGPKIELYDLDVYPRVVEPGGTVLISVRVENTGLAPGIYSATISAAGSVIETFEGTLVAGKAKTLGITTTFSSAGSYNISVGNLSDQVVVLPLLVDQEIPSEFAISELATTAIDADGNALELTGSSVKLQEDTAGNAQVVLPVGLAIGSDLTSFEDKASGITIKEGKLTLPVRDINGDITMQITGDISLTEGTGNSAVATLKKGTIKLKISDQVVDMSLADPSIGEAMVGFTSELAQIPDGAQLAVIPKKSLSPDAYIGFEALANKTELSIADVAMVVEVNRTNLKNGTHVGSTTAQLRVGSDWVNTVGGVSAIQIARQADDGFMELLETEFVGKDAQGRMMFEGISPSGFSVFALIALAPESEDFAYSQLIVEPSVVAPGEAVDINVTVLNEGSTAQTKSVFLEVNGVSQDVRSITLAAKAQSVVRFTLIREAVGNYEIKIGELTGSFGVGTQLDKGLLGFDNLVIDPEVVKPGESVTITASVTNNSQRGGKFDIELSVNDVLTDIAPVILGAKESKDISFVYKSTAEGRYTVTLDGLSGTFSVEEPLTPADISVTSLTLSQKEIAPGDTVTVTLVLVNNGQQTGTEEISLLVDGDVDQSREITVLGSATEPVTFGVSRSLPGTYTVSVGEFTETFRVIAGALEDLEYGLSITIVETSETFAVGRGAINIEPGQTLEVKVSVGNTNQHPVERTIDLMVDGTIMESREIELDAGETKDLTFVVNLTGLGQHTISVGNVTQVIDVRAESGISLITIGVAAVVVIIIVAVTVALLTRRSVSRNVEGNESADSSDQQ